MRQIGNLCIAGIFAIASAGFAQYNMELTGVGDGVVADGVYVSPYVGTISQAGKTVYTGYMICDDFLTESYLDTPWNATETNAGAVGSSVKFGSSSDPLPKTGPSAGYTQQQDYDAVAWLANQLVDLPLSNPSPAVKLEQTDIAFAIWDIFDGATTNPDGGTLTWINAAFAAVKGGYVANNVEVFTASPLNASQEFLVVNPSVKASEASTPVLLGIDLITFFGLFLIFARRRRASA